MKMKETDFSRRVDDLGRIVIPKDVRVKTGIEDGEPFEIMYDKNGVYFKRYKPMQESDESIEWQSEFAYILKFIKESEGDIIYMEQLRALWTAFCLHQNIDVDTHKYDDAMLDIVECLKKTDSSLYKCEFEKFYNEMSKYLV